MNQFTVHQSFNGIKSLPGIRPSSPSLTADFGFARKPDLFRRMSHCAGTRFWIPALAGRSVTTRFAASAFPKLTRQPVRLSLYQGGNLTT